VLKSSSPVTYTDWRTTFFAITVFIFMYRSWLQIVSYKFKCALACVWSGCRTNDCWLVVGKKASTKAPKIQRLVTPLVLQRKRHRLAQKRRRATKKREEAAEYQKLLAQRLKEAKERKLERRRTASHSKSSMTRTDSTSSAGRKWKHVAECRTTVSATDMSSFARRWWCEEFP